MATHSSVLAWRIPETGEPGGLPSMGLLEWIAISSSRRNIEMSKANIAYNFTMSRLLLLSRISRVRLCETP